jgi:hypothetical protein
MSRNKRVVAFVIAVVVIAVMSIVAELQAAQPNSDLEVRISEVAWAGTIHSATHEWLELEVVSGVLQQPLHLVSIRETTTTTITLPSTTQPKGAGELALYIRTSDANLPHVTADAVYTGALVDSGVCELRLYSGGQLLDTIDMNDNCQWPAGSNSPRSSMQLVDGQWYTSNDGYTIDAGGNLVLGTPGTANVLPNPSPEPCTIGQWPGAYSYEFGFDPHFIPRTVLSYTSWGTNNGDLVLVNGHALIEWHGAWEWVLPEDGGHGDLTVQCRQNMMDLLIYMTNRLNGDTGQDQSGHDEHLDDWTDALRAFQRSGLTVSYLPVIMSPEGE